MSVGERIRVLRKSLGLGQGEFGERLSMSQNHVSQLETGARQVSDKIIRSVCYEYKVNEAWLRTGSGEVFTEDEGPLNALVDEYKLDATDKSIMRLYMKLDKKERDIFKSFILHLAETIMDSEPDLTEDQRTELADEMAAAVAEQEAEENGSPA